MLKLSLENWKLYCCDKEKNTKQSDIRFYAGTKVAYDSLPENLTYQGIGQGDRMSVCGIYYAESTQRGLSGLKASYLLNLSYKNYVKKLAYNPGLTGKSFSKL